MFGRLKFGVGDNSVALRRVTGFRLTLSTVHGIHVDKDVFMVVAMTRDERVSGLERHIREAERDARCLRADGFVLLANLRARDAEALRRRAGPDAGSDRDTGPPTCADHSGGAV